MGNSTSATERPVVGSSDSAPTPEAAADLDVPSNVHVQAVTDLLDVVQHETSGTLLPEEEAALATAIRVLRSRRLRERVAGAGRRDKSGSRSSRSSESGSHQPNFTDGRVGWEYEIQPFYESIHEQLQAMQDSYIKSPVRGARRLPTPEDEDQATSADGRGSSSSSSSHSLPPAAVNSDFPAPPRKLANSSGSSMTFKPQKHPAQNQKLNGRELSLLRGVSFSTFRTLRTLSVQENGAQNHGRGKTTAYQIDKLTSAHGNMGLHKPRNFDDYKCFIPRAVLKEIFAFSGQGQHSHPVLQGVALVDINLSGSTPTTPAAASSSDSVQPVDQEDTVFTATEPYQRSYEAAVLFADMSGFTALTERLAARTANDGAELLCVALNNFFGVILEVVEEYGGDCVKFAGDALCVLWTVQRPTSRTRRGHMRQSSMVLNELVRGENNRWRNVTSLEQATVAAGLCSAEIHRRLKGYPRSHEVQLTVHMGLGAGRIKMLYVGGKFGRWEFVVSGAPMAQIAIAEPLAQAGETVCSLEAWAVIKNHFTGKPLGAARSAEHHDLIVLGAAQDNSLEKVVQQIHAASPRRPRHVQGRRRRPEAGTHGSSAVPSKQLFASDPEPQAAELATVHLNIGLTKSFIPNAIYQQLASGYTGALIAEMRDLSVLFVKVTGLAVQGQKALQDMQDMMVAVQEATYLFEGSINKLLIDDKGLLILIGFGLPPLAHEDDPLRAVAAACEIRHRLSFAAYGPRLHTHIGITSGEIFCGVVGNDVRREYTVMGDLVNLSARLMGTAERNSILVDEATAVRCVSHVQFHTVPPLIVKGKVRPVQPFTPDGWFTDYAPADERDGAGGVRGLASNRMMNQPHFLDDSSDDGDDTGGAHLSMAGMSPEKRKTAISRNSSKNSGPTISRGSSQSGRGISRDNSQNLSPPISRGNSSMHGRTNSEEVRLNPYFEHIRNRGRHLAATTVADVAPGGFAGDRDDELAAAGSIVEAAGADGTAILGRETAAKKLLRGIEASGTGSIFAIIGETGIGKSAFVAKVGAMLGQKRSHVVVGVDFGDNTGHVQHLPDTETGATPWCTRMTEVGILPSFQAWKSAILQAIAQYLYAHPAEATDRTVIEAYTAAILKLVPSHLRRFILLISSLFPELHLESSDAIATAADAIVALDEDDDNAVHESLEGMLEARKTELVCQILEGILRATAPNQTLVCVLDSCQSFDSFSWTLLTQFSQSQAGSEDVDNSKPSKPDPATLPHGGKVIVVVMSRPIRTTSQRYRDFTWLLQRAAQGSNLIHLGEMEPKHCKQLVYRHMRAHKVPAMVLDFIAAHSHGNPLHLIELCRHLLAEQVVYMLNGECRYRSDEARGAIAASMVDLAEGTTLTYPRQLIQNARSRLDRLSPTMQLITKVASILPRYFLLWQLLFIVESAGDDLQHSPSASGTNSPREYLLDVSGSTYVALEQLVLSGVFKAVKGGPAAVVEDGTSSESNNDRPQFVDAYELELPLPGESVLTFHSPTIRSCAATLLLSAQKSHIQALVSQEFAQPE